MPAVFDIAPAGRGIPIIATSEVTGGNFGGDKIGVTEVQNADDRPAREDVERTGTANGLQEQAARELSSRPHNILTRHENSQAQIDAYKDRLGRRLEKQKGGKPTRRGQGGDFEPGKENESAETVALERKLLKDISGLGASEQDEFKANLQIFIRRAHKQGLDEKAEVDSTLKTVDRLFNPGAGEQNLDKLFGTERGAQLRTMLAEQIISEAAYPSRTDQGHFGTCPVASLETRTWFAKPSVASSMIADEALTGQWASSDGHVVKLPEMDFTPDKYSRELIPPDGMRSYAGQIFQATALSDVGTRQSTPMYYAAGGIEKSAGGVENGIEYWSDASGKKIAEYGGLDDVPDAQEMRRLLSSNTVFLSSDASEKGLDPNVIVFTTKEELKQQLKEAQENGRMPVLITVASNDKFFGETDDNGGHALDHDICVDKYDPVTGNMVIDNQWGAKFDWGTKSALGSPEDANPVTNIDDFFPCTQGQAGLDNGLRL